ncbi:MAG: thioesterase family protein [Catalinimonas sp.]
MFTHETHVRVRYAETDQMGYVYYGNYATYYEVARVEALRSLGITYKSMEAGGVIMPVAENYSKYIRPARYDDLLRVVVTIKERPGTRIQFHYEVFDEGGALLHLGHTKLVFCSGETGRPCAPPEDVRRVMAPFFAE